MSSSRPGGRLAYFSKCSGRNGSEIFCSSLNHLPKSINRQRREQNGPYWPANQSPVCWHTGHLIAVGTLFGFAGKVFEVVQQVFRGGVGRAGILQNFLQIIGNHLELGGGEVRAVGGSVQILGDGLIMAAQ